MMVGGSNAVGANAPGSQWQSRTLLAAKWSGALRTLFRTGALQWTGFPLGGG